MGGINPCDYRSAQMTGTVVYETARTGGCLNVAMKKSQHFPLQGRTIVAWLFARMKHK
jgi:hypothetical protein